MVQVNNWLNGSPNHQFCTHMCGPHHQLTMLVTYFSLEHIEFVIQYRCFILCSGIGC